MRQNAIVNFKADIGQIREVLIIVAGENQRFALCDMFFQDALDQLDAFLVKGVHRLVQKLNIR